jgi:hypothetical protein
VPTVTKVFSPGDIFQGPADIYIGVTNPVSATPPVAGTNTLSLDQFGQPAIGTSGQISAVAVNAGGSGYTAGDTLTIVQSGGIAGMVRVLTVSSGAVATVAIINGGQGYATATGLATTGGTGTGATINISTITAGFHLGLTEGPASVNIQPKFELIKADQFSAEVDAAFVTQKVELDFTLKEFAFANLQRLFAGLFSATYWSLVAGGTNPARDLLTIGNTTSSQAKVQSLLMVSPRRDANNKFLYVMAYKTHIQSAIQMHVQRAKEGTFKLKFNCLADTTRVATDMTLQIVRGL